MRIASVSVVPPKSPSVPVLHQIMSGVTFASRRQTVFCLALKVFGDLHDARPYAQIQGRHQNGLLAMNRFHSQPIC